jgi:hypothetical protein
MLLCRRSGVHDHRVHLGSNTTARPFLRSVRHNQRNWLWRFTGRRSEWSALLWLLPRCSRPLRRRRPPPSLGTSSDSPPLFFSIKIQANTAKLPTNSPRYGKRTTSTGLQLTLGNASGVMSAFIYPASDAPGYTRGHAVTLSMVGLGTAIYAFMWWWYRRENDRRDEGTMSGRRRWEGLTEEELMELGDDSPRYRYTI